MYIEPELIVDNSLASWKATTKKFTIVVQIGSSGPLHS